MSSPAPTSAPPSDATMILKTGAAATGYRLRIVESRDASLVGKEFHLEGPCLIGRADECNVVLKGDTGVSRRHARIEWTRAGVVLRDEKSANGTWVGDRRIDSILLDHLDRFRVGYSVFELIEDRDEAGDDLEAIRTTSIPVKEILAEIQSKLAKGLEEEGEAILVAGNKPFFLDDPESFWLVVEGRLDVFTVVIVNGEPGGARTHFTSVETGQAAFGMDLATYGMGSGFLASGKSGVRLRRIPVARAAELAAAGTHVDRLARLVDVWIASLAKALVKDLPVAPPADVILAPGEEATLSFQTRAAAKRDVVWIEAKSGELLEISLAEIEGEADPLRVALTPDAWVDSTVAELHVKAVTTASLVPDPSFWKSLEVFHQVLCSCEFLNKRLATVDEFNRLRSKAHNAEAARVAAYEDIRAVMATSEKRAERPESADADPVFQASRSVCRALGMEAIAPPESKGDRSFDDSLQLVAVASRFRTRQVALRGDWWTLDQGPILAKTEGGKVPVALLPTSPRSYDHVDVKTGVRSPVTAEFARTLDPFGYVFYRRFPDGILGVRDVVKFGLFGLKPDVRTLVLMGLLMGALGSLTPYFSGRIFDSAIPQAERGLLWQFAIALVVSAFASTAFKLTQSIAVLRLQGKMDYSIQAALWDRLLDLPSTFFRKYSSGDLADRAQGIDAIRGLLQGAGISAVLGAMSSVFYVVLMLTYDVTLAALGIALTFVFVTFSTTANYLQLRYQRTQMGMNGRLTGLVIQLISGVGKLRVCGAEEHGFRVWAREFAEQRRLSFKVGQVKNVVAVFNSAFPIFSSMAIFTTLVWSQSHSKGEQAGISTGNFIAFSASYGLFLAAMQSLSDASLSLLKAVPIWERLEPILTTPAEIDDTKAAPGPIKGGIELSRVHFRYAEDAPYILKDLSLKIEPGEFVAFVGGSGCGKSTAMRLMLGFEKPEKGAIYYDGQDLSQLDVRLVRQQLGVVLQDNRVLPADIFRNIVGTSSRTIDEAWEAAEASGFAEDVRNMPMGMHTYVSEGGGGFSGGQKQRLMIARAIVNKPRVLFLDEATSALDNKTQATVTESMDKMNATRIVIAHRLSTIINAHKICYFESGVVKEMGTYDELMKKDGLFAALARRQTV